MTKLRNSQFYLLAVLSPILFLIPVIFSLINSPILSEGNKPIRIGVISSSSLGIILSEYRGITYIPIEKINKNRDGTYEFSDYYGIIDLSPYSSLDSVGKGVKIYLASSDEHILGTVLRKSETWLQWQQYVSAYSKNSSAQVRELLYKREVELNPVYPSQKEHSFVASVLSYTIGMLIYLTLILYNNNLLRSMAEEKSNKLAEVLSIYIDPKYLVLGKILGMSIASLLQVAIWIIAYAGYFLVLIWYDANYIGHYDSSVSPIDTLMSFIQINIRNTVGIEFPLFFFLGILLNGAIFSIIATLSSSKAGRFLTPLGNMLIILTIYFGMYVAGNPDTEMTQILSYLPISSYIAIPVLSVYGIPKMRIFISLFVLSVGVALGLLLSITLYKKSLRC